MMHYDKISIRALKRNIVEKFPYSVLAKTVLSEPDELGWEQFLAKSATWIAIFDAELDTKVRSTLSAKGEHA